QSKITHPDVAAAQSGPERSEHLVAPDASIALAPSKNRETEIGEAYDQPGEAARFYSLKRLPQGETEIPVERYLTAREQMREMPQYSTAEDRVLPSRSEMGNQAAPSDAAQLLLGTWTSLGPGNVGGRTRAIVIHPTNPNIMY